jgi:hypothetical protein
VTVRVGGDGQIEVGFGMHKGVDVVAVPTGTDPLVADDFPEPPHAARTKKAGSSNRTIRTPDRFRTPRAYSPNATTEASGE